MLNRGVNLKQRLRCSLAQPRENILTTQLAEFLMQANGWSFAAKRVMRAMREGSQYPVRLAHLLKRLGAGQKSENGIWSWAQANYQPHAFAARHIRYPGDNRLKGFLGIACAVP